MLKMRKSNHIIESFFSALVEDYILNTLLVLHFMLKVPSHHKRLQEILTITSPDISINNLERAIQEEIQYYEKLIDKDDKYLMREIKTDVLNSTPILWFFIALYWAYDFKNKSFDSIFEVYNPEIGDIALKFLMYFLKEKKNKSIRNEAKRSLSYYKNLSAKVVRIIEILANMHTHKNNHILELYFPDKNEDLALSFLRIQNENPWEQDTLSIVERKKPLKSYIRYQNPDENLDFKINTSRMCKSGALNDLDKTYDHLQQLHHLDPAKTKKKNGLKKSQKSIKNKVSPTSSGLEEELICEDNDTGQVTIKDKNSPKQQLKSKVYRRDMKDFSDIDEDSEEEVKEYVIPNAFQQHKRNIAFSSKLSKEGLLLKSDYDIPVIEHLKAFISTLNTEDNDSEIYIGYFILNVSLGCKIQDLLSLLQESKAGPFQLKNGVMSVDIDSSLFAGNYSHLLSQGEDKLVFSMPVMMTALIVAIKRTFRSKDFNETDFLEGYKKFLKDSVEKFPKRITIKWKRVNRYLAQYLQDNGKDVLTSKLATAAYSQNDTAKLAYLSSRTNATEHSPLMHNYWNEFDFDMIVSKIIGINIIPSTHTSNITSNTFCGSSQAVETHEAYTCFQVLRQNIYDHHDDKDLYFNLVSIYTRFAMSLLVGTRPFIESANFTSYDEETGIWGISEKAQNIASGARLVPVCNTMKSILNNYQELLKERGLKNNFYLIVNGKTVTFSKYLAYKFLQNTHNLDDIEILEEYIENVPLNTGRHLFMRKAIDDLRNVHHISTYLGHYAAGEEQFGIYSTLDFQNYSDAIKTLTTKIAKECGIKEL